MPGFKMAKVVADEFDKNPNVEGIVLLNHGLITFGETAKESYALTIKWVTKAERLINQAKPFSFASQKKPKSSNSTCVSLISQFIRKHSVVNDSPFIVRHRTSKTILDFVSNPKACALSQFGPSHS